MKSHSQSPAETRALGRALAAALDAETGNEGWVVALNGPLGAGKTEFAKGLAEGLGLSPSQITSPTFAIANEWACPGGTRLVHADWYRIENAIDLEAAGLDDWLEPGTGLLVEWGERFPEALPADRLELRLVPGDAAADRWLSAEAGGISAKAVLSAWSQACVS